MTDAGPDGGLYTGLTLLPQHAALLRASAIAPEVAQARGYRGVTKAATLERLGFGWRQCRMPGLLIPIYTFDDTPALYQYRPDEPRIRDGKLVKYETPGGERLVLDIPRSIRPLLADPAVPLIVTEGSRKADSAVSHGLCAIALIGVWGWRGTNEHGGKVALAAWERIALNGRSVYLCVVRHLAGCAGPGELRGAPGRRFWPKQDRARGARAATLGA